MPAECPCGLAMKVPVGPQHGADCVRASWAALDEAILAAAWPALRAPNWHTVHMAAAAAVAGMFGAGEVDERLIQLVREQVLVYGRGRLLKKLRPVPAEHAACRQRTDAERVALAGRVTGEERLRIDLGTALLPFADPDDGPCLLEWHPCVDTPACRAAADPPGPCACSGIPYLSDAAWAALRAVLARIALEA